MKKAKVPLTLQAIAVLLTLGVTPLKAQAQPSPEPQYVIIHSNDVLGELEPCGCRNNPLGGMIRKDQLLKTHEALRPFPESSRLQVDSGDLFFSGSEIPATLQAQSEIQSQSLAQALKITGLQVITPGEKDFALGVPFFKKLVQIAKIKAISANLQWKSTEQGPWRPLLPASALITLKSKSGKRTRIALLGISGSSIPWPNRIRATDPVIAARKILPRLKKTADWIFVLSHQGLDEDLRLARAVPGIDRILGAHTQSFLQQELLEGKTRIHQTSFRNQHVGLIPLPDGRSQLLELGASLDPSPQETSEIQKIVDETRSKITEANLKSQKTIDPHPQSFKSLQTFSQCSECHLKQFEFWRKTPHLSAFGVLAQSGSETNKECLGCHTVGFGQKNGFSELKDLVEWQGDEQPPTIASLLKDLRDARSPEKAMEIARKAKRIHATVQCENCHIPRNIAAGDHPFALDSGFSPVNTDTCLSCHTPARAPSWYGAEAGGTGELNPDRLQEKFKKMACPRDDSTP